MNKSDLKRMIKESIQEIGSEPSQPLSVHRTIQQDFNAGKRFLVLTPTENNTFQVKLYGSKSEAYNAVRDNPHSVFYVSKLLSGFYN